MGTTDPKQLFPAPTRPTNNDDGGVVEPDSPDTHAATEPIEYVDLFSHADTHRPR